MITLVLGPVRSGKSMRAAVLARASGRPVIAAVTAAIDPSDAEMVARVERHRRDRPPEWTVVETARETALPQLIREAPADSCVLVDALGTWLAALLVACDERDAPAILERHSAELESALEAATADVILVAEETGWGVVPASVLGRAFRDALGRLSRRLAVQADTVELVVAGYAVDLRRIGTPIAATERSVDAQTRQPGEEDSNPAGGAAR
ncbi:MAG TPA: bifunctional adenosylcobinamide kinase/adenosylcobinamide-phosphate guanylyltransferase [Candidatus Elarobacter sp.]|jgi:adenosylcobinamide kinase/adenosylcobinamide-phosphate guanylyltransferase|nr:bifunctional adenosylcobinamide kinase/adenosylcobinamide-phosphate guanylyltransferase [Candidatus Elarobacter sp.]